MLGEQHRKKSMCRDEPCKSAVLIDDGKRRLAMADRMPRGHFLIDARRHEGSVLIHERGYGGVCRRFQQVFNRDDTDEAVITADDEMASAVEPPADETLTDVAHQFGRLRDRHLSRAVRRGRLEGGMLRRFRTVERMRWIHPLSPGVSRGDLRGPPP